MSHPGLLYVLAASLPLLTTLVLLIARQRARTWAGWLAAGVLSITVALSVTGLVLHQQHVQHLRDQLLPVEPWTGSIVWMKLTHLFYDNTGRLGFATDTPGIELQLGYQVDSLTTFLFVLISLVALAIHLVAIRSMWKEHKSDIYDPLAKVHRPGRYPQFFLLLSAFTSVMLHLVLADNLVQLFACWELVGLMSYLLIGFYREQQVAQTAARKAFVMNRVGDAGLLVGIVILFTFTGTLSLVTVREDVIDVLGNPVVEQGVIKKRIDRLSLADALRVPAKDSHEESFTDKGAEAGQICRVNRTVTRQGKQRLEIAATGSDVVVWNQETLNGHYDKPMRGRFDAFNPKLIGGHGQGLRTIPYYVLVIAGLGLVLGCLGKSAQWPLQTWLPDAMAGPTPVSALVHSATMVAAGVYLLARLFPILLPEVLLGVAYVGVATALYGALCALVQTDVKRLLAYSTMSQLGLMMAAIGVGAWTVALWHLATHACCKALLFLGTGSVVDQCHGVQDISRLGGLRRNMPWLAGLMLFGCLSLMGLPFLPGWYSKDGIL
jgi:NADH-quinone oxidoreductase subunit L